MLCGVTDNEFTIFKYPDGYYISATFLDFENPVDTVNVYRNKFTNITPTFVNSDSSAVFVSAATYSEALTNAGGNVYLFESRQKPFSMHVTDMQYFIGIHREKNHTTDMDILDSFYSKLLVNFTKFGSPSPNWEKYDPSKMNFMAMEIDTEQGIEPKMENGFHEELVNFWLINMMQIDRNIIEMKLNGEYNSFDGRAQLTTKHIGVPTSLPIIYAPAVSDPENLELISVLNQWWFYVSILLLFVIVSVLFIVCKKAVNVKRQPLLV
ncbi:Carboxylic ester hydrolase [Caenorhabditis elegans]|nr:Carboxylic ester hydrolase [Caenorhabditis elegans]CAR97807.1 Carboxylic ester hydrolase [Caenorhabditis elegans]|eukprot:NP_001257188.1 Carboxylic ester hydrolase [Caenorhabditis elegans]